MIEGEDCRIRHFMEFAVGWLRERGVPIRYAVLAFGLLNEGARGD